MSPVWSHYLNVFITNIFPEFPSSMILGKPFQDQQLSCDAFGNGRNGSFGFERKIQCSFQVDWNLYLVHLIGEQIILETETCHIAQGIEVMAEMWKPYSFQLENHPVVPTLSSYTIDPIKYGGESQNDRHSQGGLCQHSMRLMSVPHDIKSSEYLWSP